MVIGACLGLSLLAPAAAEEPTPFRLCVDPDNLPFSSTSPATPGFDVELGSAIAHALNRPFQPVWVPTYYIKRQIRRTLLAGQCDAVAGLPDDASFMGPRLVFSKPVAQFGYAVVAPKTTGINRAQDLHDRRVAVQFASPPQDVLATQDSVRLVTDLSPEAAMRDLAAGKADAAFIWGPSAGWLNETVYHDAYTVSPVVGNPVVGNNMAWHAAIAFPGKNTVLRDEVDHALGNLGPDIEALSAKYHFPGSQVSSPAAQAQLAARSQAAPPPSAQADLVSNPGDVGAGHKLFNETCAHCHGTDAVQGEQRRNLRLLARRYGGQMSDMFMTTVTHGRLSKGMPNWSGILSDQEFHAILAFLKSVQDSGS